MRATPRDMHISFCLKTVFWDSGTRSLISSFAATVVCFRVVDAVPCDQNVPVTAITEWVRDPQFVSEEWDQVTTLPFLVSF